MRCPACGATNPDAAQWCGQCFTSLEEPSQEPEPEPGAAAAAAAPDAPGQAAADGVQREVAQLATTGFRRSGDEIEWECARCGAYNAMDVMACTVCGATLADRYRSGEPEKPVSWNAALALSMVLPGAGHLAAGRTPSGAARALLFSIWLVGAVLLLTGGGAALVAAPLILGVLVLWGGSLLDVVNLQNGRPEVLAGRALLWLVVGITALLLVVMLVTALGATATS